MIRNRPSQLCQIAGVWNSRTPIGGTWVEPKIDGWRALWINGELYSRNGISIGGMSHIAHRLNAMERAAGEPMFFDAELQIGGTLKATKEHCESGYKLGDAGTLHLFDCLTMRQWDANDCDATLYERKAMLRRLVEQSTPDPWEWREGTRGREPEGQAVVVMPDLWIADAQSVVDQVRDVWQQGGEGFVIKDAMAPYRRNKCQSWQKLKQEGHHLKWAI